MTRKLSHRIVSFLGGGMLMVRAAHSVQADNPAVFNAAVLRFLAS
jgi:hypothetical protein